MGVAALVLFNVDPRTYVSPTNAIYAALGLLYYATLDPAPPAAPLALLAWASAVVARNLLLTYVIYSAWYHWLYVRRASAKKLQPDWPSNAQLAAEKHRTAVGAAVGSLGELACAAVAAARRPAEVDERATDDDPWRIGLEVTVGLWLASIWADYHFFAVHRVMHAWFPPGSRWPDGGRWLYRHVHSVHHKSHNPNPWSGLSMHPVEHALYFSRAPLYVALCRGCAVRCHPVVWLACGVRALLGPAPGHHGFEDHMGSKFHNLHHRYFECNYGTRPTDGMDWLFGTLRTE